MWEYVNQKYVLPQTESVKKWVLESIGCAWRLFKCRLKANHYYKYDNDSERWKHRPSRIPDSHFKLLLQYWNTSAAKKISSKNSENRELLDNMHTAGPVSFARIYQKLATRDGKIPSKRMMFEETRKRKDGRNYKKSYDDTLDKIEKMKELEVLHKTGLSDSDVDPFDKVMGSSTHG
uniref:Uncharacterized protein n=1 Tax=Opuntia streptacantha TaxID=393608 RepID=A0A7C8Z8N8_OPUST